MLSTTHLNIYDILRPHLSNLTLLNQGQDYALNLTFSYQSIVQQPDFIHMQKKLFTSTDRPCTA